MSHKLFEEILKKRGLTDPKIRKSFLSPDYTLLGDPLLLPDVKKAIARLKKAHVSHENVVIYGDYDIDGLSATTLLYDALTQWGFAVSTFIPSRFDDGYGLSSDAIDRLADLGAQLIITVDCGSLSIDEVAHAKTRGVDVIITDHHNIGDELPDAVAVINPKRTDHDYPFRDFAGVGVAFGLVRAIQKKLPGLPDGHEKWLLDLVALGTICDIVSLTGENRTLAYWGLEVMKKTHRPGLKALMAVAKIDPETLNARSLGFGLGPRLNASGRLETAQLSLDVLTAADVESAYELSQQLDAMNTERRKEQNRIFGEAIEQAERYLDHDVLVLSNPEWSHGIIGIVAAKILEKYHKPTFVLQEIGDETKGSARSFGDFSVGDAIKHAKPHITRGGGHKLAAGVTLPTRKIDDFRGSVNDYYRGLGLKNQKEHLLPKEDISVHTVAELTEELVALLAQLEPYGNENPQPIFRLNTMTVIDQRKMGDLKQHVKLQLEDQKGQRMSALAFSAPDHFFVEPGDSISAWMTLDINEWRGRRLVEGKLLHVVSL
jgi:single-stranded-DNA-specific exonuclease